MLQRDKRVHFIGIGGTGMSSLAMMLLRENYKVSGSDLKENRFTLRLKQNGAKVVVGHSPSNVNDVDVVVISSAIPQNNIELLTAKQKNLKILKRAELLAKFMENKYGIAVAGTHGKTTTTSLIGACLQGADLAPTVVVGGELQDFGANIIFGNGNFLVAEADESDGSFLNLNPNVAVVTNVENDHLDYYGSFDNILNTFKLFLRKVPEDGAAIICAEDENLNNISKTLKTNVIKYGFNRRKCDFWAENLKFFENRTEFVLRSKTGIKESIYTRISGTHNILNIVGAFATGKFLDINTRSMIESIAEFKGVRRRFDILLDEKVVVVDDYAHHPTELLSCINTARLKYKGRRLILVFQPHRYSRTAMLFREFACVMEKTDIGILTDIYPAGERALEGVSGELIYNCLSCEKKKQVHYFKSFQEIYDYLLSDIKEDDVLIFAGAGDINILADNLKNALVTKFNKWVKK